MTSQPFFLHSTLKDDLTTFIPSTLKDDLTTFFSHTTLKDDLTKCLHTTLKDDLRTFQHQHEYETEEVLTALDKEHHHSVL